MVQARFINDVKQVEVHAENQETTVSAKGVISHDDLTNRNLPDQHIISAITGLQEALQEVADKTYVHEQAIASTTWVIHHNLNKRPSYDVVDSAGNAQDAAAKYIDDNTIELYFNSPFVGKAFLN